MFCYVLTELRSREKNHYAPTQAGNGPNQATVEAEEDNLPRKRNKRSLVARTYLVPGVRYSLRCSNTTH